MKCLTSLHNPALGLLVVLAVLGVDLTGRAQAAPPRPNILVIVADDLGWSDVGAFGSEIRTPNINWLASHGLSMTQFYVAPTCSPTRSMLLTGVDNHLTGVGTMEDMQAPNQLASINYTGELHTGVVTLAEVLKANGYDTLMSGKWHLGLMRDHWPDRRGFEQSFALLNGGASHFGDGMPLYPGENVQYVENGKPVKIKPDFYSSISYTDKAIEFLDHRETGKPFFAYLAYTAPHDPLQVPDAWLDRYKGAYDAGPDAVRAKRAARLRKLGWLPPDAALWKPDPFPSWLPVYKPEWSERTKAERALDARPMEIYAAMIELLDQQIGRVLTHLRDTGQLENTYVIFMSDNGANAATPLFYPHTTRDWYLTQHDNSPANMGRPGSDVSLGGEWAPVANTPGKLFKGTVGEGGVKSPLIVSGPGVPENAMTKQLSRMTDFVPTVLDMLGISTDGNPLYAGKTQPQGHTLKSVWLGGKASDPAMRTIGTELFGNMMARRGQWKAYNVARPLGKGRWELYDLDADPGETHDLAAAHPDVLISLIAAYDAYAKRNEVIPPDPQPKVALNQLYLGECNWWCNARLSFADWAEPYKP
tara:strand:+ start:2513 stop:4279 length:1767 start_codon:yes stop_codon:yes gene_type:complete